MIYGEREEVDDRQGEKEKSWKKVFDDEILSKRSGSIALPLEEPEPNQKLN